MKMKYTIVLFIIVFFSLYGGLSYYIGLRGWQGIGSSIPMLNSKIYWTIFWIISISYILAQLLERYLPAVLSETFEIIGGYWMAAMFYLLLVIPLIDLIRVLNRRIQFLPSRFTQHENTALVISIFVLIFLTLLMIYGTWSGRSPKVTKYNIEIAKQTGGLDKLKVVMVSDIHLGSIIDNSRLTVMVDRINELGPDIVLIPGDILDSRLEPFTSQKMGENFKRLNTRYGVYACLGNHDGMGGKAEDAVKEFENAGMKILRDKAVLVNNNFYVIGRDDSSVYRGSEGKRKSLADILEGIDKSKPMLLMDHQPKELEITEKEAVDLQVSGHTHRGQFFPNNLITSKIFEIDYGYLKKGNLNTIVSSGFGTWGPPIRIGSRSEIVEISINFK
jgi:uncharacterized protein